MSSLGSKGGRCIEKGPLEKGHGKTSRQERWFILLAGEF